MSGSAWSSVANRSGGAGGQDRCRGGSLGGFPACGSREHGARAAGPGSGYSPLERLGNVRVPELAIVLDPAEGLKLGEEQLEPGATDASEP